MANFEWLNEIPDERWERAAGGGYLRMFSVGLFLRLSDGEPGTWRQEFDRWKVTQSRAYENFDAPPFNGLDMVLITMGARDA